VLKTTFSVIVFSFIFLACSNEEKLDKSLTKEEIDEVLKTIKDKNPKEFTEEQWNALYQDYLYRNENKEEFTAISYDDVKEFMEASSGVKTVIGKYSEENTDYDIAPKFEGGMNEFRKFVAKNFKTPKLEQDFKGKVLTQFTIEEDGTLSDIEIIRGKNEFI